MGTSVTSIEGPFILLLLLLKVCFAYSFIVRFVSGVLQSALVLFAQKEMLLASNFSLICGIQYSLRNHTQLSARYTNGCDEAQHQSQLV